MLYFFCINQLFLIIAHMLVSLLENIEGIPHLIIFDSLVLNYKYEFYELGNAKFGKKICKMDNLINSFISLE
jgi:hypothetical protein